jgi:hypothetical protein
VDGRLTRSTLLILLLASPTTSGGVPVLELLCEKILYERKQGFPCRWFINSSAIHRSLLQSLTRRKAPHKEEDQDASDGEEVSACLSFSEYVLLASGVRLRRAKTRTARTDVQR